MSHLKQLIHCQTFQSILLGFAAIYFIALIIFQRVIWVRLLLIQNGAIKTNILHCTVYPILPIRVTHHVWSFSLTDKMLKSVDIFFESFCPNRAMVKCSKAFFSDIQCNVLHLGRQDSFVILTKLLDLGAPWKNVIFLSRQLQYMTK